MKKQIRTFLLMPVMFSTILAACHRDKIPDTNSPAFHIQESEKLPIPAAIELPGNLPNGNARVATFYAEGIQKYKAKQVPGSNPPAFEWIFVAPQADLFDESNAKVGTHSAGPTWQLIGSTSDSIYAQAFTPAKVSASPDLMSVDWLQLMPKAGTTPTGLFAKVSYIQRIATKGGKAPATLPQTADETIDVPYSAIYRFSKIIQ